jgi:hypothetical protein
MDPSVSPGPTVGLYCYCHFYKMATFPDCHTHGNPTSIAPKSVPEYRVEHRLGIVLRDSEPIDLSPLLGSLKLGTLLHDDNFHAL